MKSSLQRGHGIIIVVIAMAVAQASVLGAVIGFDAVSVLASNEATAIDPAPAAQAKSLPEDVLADEVAVWIKDTFALTLTQENKGQLANRLETTVFSALANADPPMQRFQKVQNISNGKIGAITGQTTSRQIDGSYLTQAVVRYDDGSIGLEDVADILSIP